MNKKEKKVEKEEIEDEFMNREEEEELKEMLRAQGYID